MPFNTTTGVYTPAAGATSAATGQVIQSAVWNSVHTDFSNALTALGTMVYPAGSLSSPWFSTYPNLSDALANIIPNNPVAAWGSYSPVVSAASGTITTLGTVAGRYFQLGNIVFITMTASITTNGSGAAGLIMSLPTVAPLLNAFTNELTLTGREDAVTGSVVIASAQGNGSIVVRTGSNAYPGQNGAVIRLGGFYETAF